ncbi:hypothetical protein FOC1_g10012606 [Fusarium oxysporum f. sp. cubense race 1]|uniref:Uncharacterized protein n=1 Tax=Fusarium oxysporum f. sp. cubense (strain race 1) TaxID=1229664 RepID=N4UH44_FUSC1|nr:hypothetical protein FOC1_g10012606 [Fusarium oxysporum f. sp. cubense race 1]
MLATRVLRAAAGGPKPNITGFNMRAFQASTGQPRYDPWERKVPIPAGTVSTAYCGYEYFFLEDEHHHGEAHGEEHH